MGLRGSAKRVIFLACLVSAPLVLAGCPKSRSVDPGAGGEAGGAAVSAVGFALESLSGKRVELSAYRGRQVLVHFWASWCPPCLPELPQILAFASKMQAKDWVVLAVSTDTDWGKVRAALPAKESIPSNFIVLLDPDSKVAEAYGSYMYPESYWVNAAGRIERKWVGPQPWEQISGSL